MLACRSCRAEKPGQCTRGTGASKRSRRCAGSRRGGRKGSQARLRANCAVYGARSGRSDRGQPRRGTLAAPAEVPRSAAPAFVRSRVGGDLDSRPLVSAGSGSGLTVGCLGGRCTRRMLDAGRFGLRFGRSAASRAAARGGCSMAAGSDSGSNGRLPGGPLHQTDVWWRPGSGLKSRQPRGRLHEAQAEVRWSAAASVRGSTSRNKSTPATRTASAMLKAGQVLPPHR